MGESEQDNRSGERHHEGPPILLEGRVTDLETRQRGQQEEERKYKNRQLWFNFLLVLVGAATVAVYAYQAHIMVQALDAAKVSADAAKSAADTASNTLKAMNSTGAETKAQIDRLIAQQQRTADAMAGTLKQSSRALDASIAMSQLDQRAWVSPVAATPPPVMEAHDIQLTISIANTGKTPALKVRVMTKAKAIPSEEKFAAEYQDASTGAASLATIAPGNHMGASMKPIPSKIVTASYIDDLNSAKTKLYFYGIVNYEDVFGRPHEMTFCVTLQSSSTYLFCPTYNNTN